MLFHTFKSQQERKTFGGSDFIELQHCQLPPGTPMETIFSLTQNWKNDSLYIFGDDMEQFYQHYGAIFTGGRYHNGKSGPPDLCGINFYSHQQAQQIIQRLVAQTPPDYQPLLHWLQSGANCIGFYLLGV